MDDLLNPHGSQETEEESFFISMTDIMVGMLFIFIMMLMYYALQVQNLVIVVTGQEDTRSEIINNIADEVRGAGVDVETDLRSGIIRLKNNVLFDSGSANLSQTGKGTLQILGTAIVKHTRCYTFYDENDGLEEIKSSECKDGNPQSDHVIDAIYIEGHTDSIPMRSDQMRDNWDLSVKRSTNTYREMVNTVPQLTSLKNSNPEEGRAQSILSVAGYSAERPVDLVNLEPNRRIDIRVVLKPISRAELGIVKNIEDDMSSRAE